MKISIAMATYNGERYIEEQLESIRLQTSPPDEVIICDDCSTDSTVEIVRRYIEKQGLGGQWQMIVNETNLGYADSFHAAASLCKGEYVFFCDQDDIWRLNKLEVMLSVMESRPEISVLYSDFRNYNTNAENIVLSLSQVENIGAERTYLNKSTIYLSTIGCAMVVRRSFLEEIDAFWFRGFAHDECMWKLSICSGALYHLPVVLLDRRCHGNNVSMKKMRTLSQRIQYVEGLAASYQSMMDYSSRMKGIDIRQQMYLQHQISGCLLRLEVLQKKAIWHLPSLLLWYRDVVKTTKSFWVEAYFGLKG